MHASADSNAVETGVARQFWSRLATGSIHLQFDVEAGKYQFYPRPVSLFGLGNALEWRAVTGAGTLMAYSTVSTKVPKQAKEPPYLVGIVRLDEGPRIFGIIDCDKSDLPRIGCRVQAAVVENPTGQPLFFFRVLPRNAEAA